MDVVLPSLSELVISVVALIVLLALIGIGVYVVVLLQRLVRAQEQIADTLSERERKAS